MFYTRYCERNGKKSEEERELLREKREKKRGRKRIIARETEGTTRKKESYPKN